MRACAVLLLLLRTAAADELPPPPRPLDRPLTLPRGVVEIGVGVEHQGETVLGVETLSAEELPLAVRWGASRRIELSASTAVRLHPDADWPPEAVLALAWSALRGRRVELAPSVRLPITAHRGYDVSPGVDLGLGLRARLSPRWFIVAGRTLLPLDARPAIAVNVALDGGLGCQVTPLLVVLADARLAELTIAGQIDRTSGPADLALHALWGVRPRLDAVLDARAGDPLRPADDFTVTLSLEVRP